MTGQVGEPAPQQPVAEGEAETASVLALCERPSLSEVADQLRRFADMVAAGEIGEVRTAAIVVERDGLEPATFGFGDADPMRQLGLLSVGVAHLGGMHIAGAVRRAR